MHEAGAEQHVCASADADTFCWLPFPCAAALAAERLRRRLQPPVQPAAVRRPRARWPGRLQAPAVSSSAGRDEVRAATGQLWRWQGRGQGGYSCKRQTLVLAGKQQEKLQGAAGSRSAGGCSCRGRATQELQPPCVCCQRAAGTIRRQQMQGSSCRGLVRDAAGVQRQASYRQQMQGGPKVWLSVWSGGKAQGASCPQPPPRFRWIRVSWLPQDTLGRAFSAGHSQQGTPLIAAPMTSLQRACHDQRGCQGHSPT